MLADHLTTSAKTENNVIEKFTSQYGRFEVKEFLFVGLSGKAVAFKSTFLMLENGSSKLSALISRH